MIVRRLAVAAVAALAAFPFYGVLAASGTSDLPHALTNALEPDFVEVKSLSNGYLVGFFDAGGYANWVGRDARGRDYYRNELVSNGFLTGYQRIWYMRNSSDLLFETVFVFKTTDGAGALLDTDKRDLSESTWFKGWVPVQLNDSAFGLQEVNSSGSFHWTFIGFSKANDAFELFRGSKTDFKTSAAVAQASQMYTVAPNGTQVAGPSAAPHQSPLAQLRTPLIITFVAGALSIGVALLIALVSTLTLRPAVQADPRRV